MCFVEFFVLLLVIFFYVDLCIFRSGFIVVRWIGFEYIVFNMYVVDFDISRGKLLCFEVI